MKKLRILLIIFAVGLSAAPANGQNFTLSDDGLMSLDWSSGSSAATLIDRTDVPGPGVLFHIYFPDNEQPDSVFRYLSCESGGAGLLSGLDVSIYDAFELKFTIVSIDGISTPDIGGLISVGSVIGPYDGSTSAYRPAWIDLVSGTPYDSTAISSTSVKTDRTSLLGILVWLFDPSDWNPSGTNLILLVEPVPGAVALPKLPAIYYVDADATGANNGSSWDHAYNDLQDALVVAESSDEIRVAQGVYTPEGPLPDRRQASNPNPANGARSVSVTADLSWTAGADAISHDVYFGMSNPPPFIGNQISTTFDPGTMAYNTTYFWRIDEVNKWGKTTGIVWSFTTIGPGPSSSAPVGDSNEAASEVIDREATFQLKNGLVIKGGYAGFSEPEPNARDIDVYETVLSGDIGIHGYKSDNSYHVVTGSGCNESAVLDGFTITAGNAHGLDPGRIGGGMLNDSGSPTVVNCMFSANSAVSGGGIYNWKGSNPTLANCTISENSVNGFGGGMFNNSGNPILINCLFSKNSAGQDGGGILNHSTSKPILNNCTFNENTARLDGGGIANMSDCSSVLTNCILWGNQDGGNVAESAQIHADDGGTLVVNYCCIQGWTGD
ncbi:MAG: hypothetical protein JSV03_06930 [Planctomycetota bacterium]|nr:MAG: hypothetical protein JSV03_06930 [Planctomycetota bacterium]